MIEINKFIFAGFVAKGFNNFINKGAFPDDLKHADVTAVLKKRQKR